MCQKCSQDDKAPTKHLEIAQIPTKQMTVLAAYTTGQLPVLCKRNTWALITICSHTLPVFAIPKKKKNQLKMLFKTIYQVYKLTQDEVKQSSLTMEHNLNTKFLMKNVIILESRVYFSTHSTP